MDIHGFADALVRQIEGARPSARLTSEAAFEQQHVVGPAWERSRKYPDIRVFTHPGNRRQTCKPSCETGASMFANRVEGCPRCWATSKAPSVVDAFGTRNNFDLVAVDRDGASLAVEVKWLLLSAGKGPNSGFQRFIGQCALAAATNDVVIGVCGFHDQRKKQFNANEQDVRAVLKKIGVHVIAVRAES